MNAVYSLKFSQAAEGLIPVPEFSRKCKSTKRRKLTILSGLLMLVVIMPEIAGASTVSAEIDYQIYRDFAENKGMFKPGATNITIYNKKGELVGILDKAPMPDFTSVNVRTNPGIATLINPQYIASVKHNDGYKNVQFGNTGSNPDNNHYIYQMIDRNDHSSQDFHAPRLNKLVTEAVPAEVSTASRTEILDTSRYTVFYRLGSGRQYIQDKAGNITQIAGSYKYLTGGLTAFPLKAYDNSSWGNGGVHGLQVYMGGNINDYSPLGSFGQPGDSGSPLFGWNAVHQRWELVGLHKGKSNGYNVIWELISQEFLTKTFGEDNDAPVTFNTVSGGALAWSFDRNTGLGSLTQNGTVYDMHGQIDSNLNAGKNLTFSGQNGVIELKNDVYQGAGSLTFSDDYTVSSPGGNIWTGAGVIVEKNATVNWKVNGLSGDALHKIGAGTLNVNASGKNTGDLRVGDGTVILNQTADIYGNKQAFNSVTITSGRPTVVLGDAAQVNPDNIYFGYRGGRLDVYGNQITFSRIKNADSGARIVNGNTEKTAQVIISGSGIGNDNQTFQGILGETDQNRVNGRLDLTYTPAAGKGILNLSSGANMNGDLNISRNGTLLLSGNPVQHAGNIIVEGDWNRSEFRVDRINVAQNASLQVTEFTALQGDIFASESSSVFLGYVKGKTQRCTVNNDSGKTDCSLINNDPLALNANARVMTEGHISLAERARLDIGSAVFTGDIQGSAGSNVTLYRAGIWNINKNSALDSFSSRGGNISFLSENWSPKTLTVSDFNAGNLRLEMGVSETGNTSDRIDILRQTAGGHNTIDLSSLFDKTVSLTDDLTLASAPAGVSHSYFGFATMNRGFTRYSPDAQVTEENGKVLWQLKAPAQAGNLVERPGQVGGNGTPENTQPETEKPEGNPTGSGGNADNNSGTAPAPSAPVAGDSLFQGADNTQLIREARDIFATREYILSDNIGRWQQVVDNTGEVSGAWAMTGYSHGGYQSFSVNQQGLDFGLRKVDGDAFWGAGVQLADGRSKSDLFRDDYGLWGISLFYGKSFTSGLFIDGALGYSRLAEDLASRRELSSLSGKVTSNLGTLGVRAGYRRDIDGMGMSVTPTVSLDTAWMDGYSLRGKDMSAELHAGNAVWGKMGVLVEKSLGKARVSAGIYRTQQLKDMPGLTLEDAWKSRQYEAVNDSRYSASLGVEGKVSDNLRVQMTLNTSFDGYFKTDAEGRLGVRYMF
ncbi:TPA: S6 family peptidase [Salmonella enterica subsp. enterica serovar Virchow]